MLREDDDYNELRAKTTLAVDHYAKERERKSSTCTDNYTPTYDSIGRTRFRN